MNGWMNQACLRITICWRAFDGSSSFTNWSNTFSMVLRFVYYWTMMWKNGWCDYCLWWCRLWNDLFWIFWIFYWYISVHADARHFASLWKEKKWGRKGRRRSSKYLYTHFHVLYPVGTDSSSEVSQSVSSLQNNITVNLVVQVLTTTYNRYLLLTVHGVGRNFLVLKIMRWHHARHEWVVVCSLSVFLFFDTSLVTQRHDTYNNLRLCSKMKQWILYWPSGWLILIWRQVHAGVIITL